MENRPGKLNGWTMPTLLFVGYAYEPGPASYMFMYLTSCSPYKPEKRPVIFPFLHWGN